MNWLLLRGLGRQSKHWLGFGESLSLRTNGRTMCLDLPGFGESPHKQSPLTIEKTTDLVRSDFLAKKNNNEPWHLLGISLGGMVALDWLHRYPNDFKSSVLINPSARDLSPMNQRISVFAIYCALRAALSKDIRKSEKQILKMISNVAVEDDEILEKMLDIRSDGLSTLNLARQLYAASRFVSPSKLQAPTLILASIKDRMVDVRCSKALAERLGCNIKYHANAGHDIPLDDSAWVIEQADVFLQDIRMKEQAAST